MDFKVEVSLWTNNNSATGHLQAAESQGSSLEFHDRLKQGSTNQELPEHQGASQETPSAPYDAAGMHIPTSAHDWIAEPHLAMNQGTTSHMLELYTLGASAGRHLSYIAEGRSEHSPLRNEIASSQAVAEQPVAPANSVPASAFAAASPSEAMQAIPLGAPTSIPERSTAATTRSDSPEPAQHRLPERWQERNIILLTGEQGTEVLVRDYQLSEQEHDELLQELLRTSRTLSAQPRQIWINGRSVWPLNTDKN